MRSLAAVVLLLGVFLPAHGATQGGTIPLPLPLFPPNNWWNLDVSAAPVDAGSASYITYGIPFIQVDGAQPKLVVDFVDYADESDGVGEAFYPIAGEAITMNGWVEGGPPGNVDLRSESDRHILIVDTANNHLYELFNVFYNGAQWEAASGAFFDMNTNDRRPEEWTSADAAGLAILPGLVRYDEVFGPEEIRHAFRVTVRATDGHVYPASHTAGSTAGATPIRAVHISELRDAANALRAAAGLAPAPFTDAALPGIPVKAIHITELRAAIDLARTTVGIPAPDYTDFTLTGLAAKAVHLHELRNRAK